MRVWLWAVLLPAFLTAFFALGPIQAHAQGIDCSRARTPTEKAICASPTLMALDRQVAVAYADAVARQPDRRDAMRTDLLGWLRTRDSTCNVPAGAIERCLSGQLTARLAALTPAASPAPAPTSPTPGPAAPVQAAADPSFPDPAIPPAKFNQPVPAATLDAASVSAAAESNTLLHVTSPGRFTLAAHSPAGAALQLVDMLTGPSDIAGAAGTQDGRLDQMLDIGTYKLRVFSAKGASGPVGLTVVPFHDAALPAALPRPGRPFSATLRDGEQRAYWLLVPPGDGPNVRIEAAGRALADLRLWRDGRELTALDPAQEVTQPVPGHFMTDLRIAGHVEPGTYLVVAYGGLPIPWTDNDTTQPFHLRAGAADTLAEGWAGGQIGPFGSEVFTIPPSASELRLDLPAAAVAELRAGDAVDTIAKNTREPFAAVSVARGKVPVAEIRGAAGQSFTLRALDASTQTVWSRPGTWWTSAVTVGLGGDEVPPTLVLERTEGFDKPPRILATTAPVIGSGAPYHARFNLRGPSNLLFQTPNGGDFAFSSTGVDVRHGRNARGSLPPGYYLLSLEPKPGAMGSIEIVLGTPGPTPPPLAAPLPPDPIIPFGVRTLATGQTLRLSGGDAPATSIGLSMRPVPVALVEGPVVTTVAAGNSLSVPILLAPGGTLSIAELGVGPIAAGQIDNALFGGMTVVIPVADHARTVAIAWHRTPTAPAPIPAPPPAGQAASVTAGTPSFLDLNRGEERGFALTVPEGGLFRVETLGRLHTTGRLATPFIPRLAGADGNGTGQNMLIQSALRAGRYRVDVKAVDSSGHLGLLASQAPLLTGGTLVPGGSVRASLPGGSGVAFPLDITGPDDGKYHFDVLSLGADWTGRLEDSEGWPVVTPGALDGLETTLRPGQYHLVVAPDVVGRQVVARLTAITKPVEITGHGPHPLPFEHPQTATWREPDSRDQPRAPDLWGFTLPGPAEVTLTLADGMTGDLRRAGSEGTVARIVRKWTGTLEAGDYQLLATSLGRNDRLAYTVGLSSPTLQPGDPRSVTLPASLPFSLAEARVVSLTSWGTIPVKAVLRRDDRTVVARTNSREGDWNIATSRLLPPGKYLLELASAAPPNVAAPSSPYVPDPGAGDAPDDDPQEAQTKATTGSAPPAKGDAAAASSDDTAETSTDSAMTTPGAAENGDAAATTIDVTLALPAVLPAIAAPEQTAQLAGNGVHILTLPHPGPGSLIVAAASSTAPSVLALERAGPTGWQTVAIASGRSPVVAAPADADPAEWRLEAWTVDGGPEPIRLAARAVSATAQSGAATLAAMEGMPAPLAVARATLPDAGIAAIEGTLPGLLAGGWPGHALERASANAVAPGKDMWLLASQPGTVTVSPRDVGPGQDTVLELPAGLAAALPAMATPDGQVAVWRVSSGSGQPNLGLASGIAETSTVALATAPIIVRGNDAMRLRIARDTPKLLPQQSVAGALQTTIPAGSALPLTLADGDKTVELSLAPGLAAFADWHAAAPNAVWTGTQAASRTMEGGWTDLLLVNTGGIAAPARITAQPAPAARTLQSGTVVKRFFGADGSFAIAFDAPPGSKLMTAGDATSTAVTSVAITTGTQGSVTGPGRAVIQHGTGPVAVWLEAPGTVAWPGPAAQSVSLPARMPLSGAAAALGFDVPTPALLHVTTTSPVFAGLQQAGRTDPPALFAGGAELHRAVAAGPVTLTLFSADDGPLGGSISVWAEKLVPLGEGLGESVAVAPGGSVAFSFTLASAATIGVGVRAEPDQAEARLLDAKGAVAGEGVAQMRHLEAGAYVLEARVPPGAPPTLLRPALIGITPRGNGPPPDVVQTYLELVGMKPQKAP